MRLDDEDTSTMGLDFSKLYDDQPDSRKPEPNLLHGRKAGQGLLQGKRNKLKTEMYEEKEEEENIKVLAETDNMLVHFIHRTACYIQEDSSERHEFMSLTDCLFSCHILLFLSTMIIIMLYL